MKAREQEALKTLLPQAVALPGDEIYKKASELFKRTLTPSVVVRPTTNKDMATATRFISEHSLPVVIKSGGHSNIVYGVADGVVLIDLSGLAEIKVTDANQGLVRVGTGALAGDIADELDAYGLGLASGDSRVVGIGGLATGGGIGFLVRKYGALVDDIVSAEVVTADGNILEVNETQDPDLFWAIRGGGSNFGIVTHVTIQAHPVDEVCEATTVYPLENVAHILKGWRDAMRQAPAELTTILTILPPRADTAASIVIHGCFIGANKEAAERAYAPLLALGKPVRHTMHTLRYKDALEAGPPRSLTKHSIARNVFLKTFTDEAIEAITSLCQEGTPPVLQIRHVAGVMNKHPLDMTAFSHRDSEVLIYHGTAVEFGANDKEVSTSLAAWRTIEPFGTGCYINMSSDASEAELAKAFPPQTLRRLRDIKARYDPHNLFNLNYNIRPAQDS